MPAAIVTGSSSGIGAATALELARAGFDVGVTWHSDESEGCEVAEQVEAEGVQAALRRLDLTELPRAADIVNELADELGGLDVFVNNAGANERTPFLELEWDDWRAVLAVNLDGSFVLGQRAAQLMADHARGGRIVNVTSVHEHIPLPESAAYCAAKGGLGLLTKSMALELAPLGITVNAVAPGATATAMTGSEGVDPRAEPRPAIPLGRRAAPEEVAGLIAWLCSPAASYVTGSSFVVDGGLMLTAAVRQ